MKPSLATALLLSILTAHCLPAVSQDQLAWSENTGWINTLPGDERGTTSTWTCLSGYAWSESIGWIFLGDGSPAHGEQYSQTTGDTGVNRDAESGLLFGYAWSENTGWIRFAAIDGSSNKTPGLDEAGNFSGYAWGENIGWIALDGLTLFPDYDSDGIANASDTDMDGDAIPDAFENTYGLSPRRPADATQDQDHDTRSAYQEYLAGTDPFDSASVFRITDIDKTGENQLLINWQGATGKSYRIVGASSIEGPYDTILTDTVSFTKYDHARKFVSLGETRFFRVEIVEAD